MVLQKLQIIGLSYATEFCVIKTKISMPWEKGIEIIYLLSNQFPRQAHPKMFTFPLAVYGLDIYFNVVSILNVDCIVNHIYKILLFFCRLKRLF